jgi:hypothetical protein
VASFLKIAEGMAHRWIETRKGVLLLQMAPYQPDSGEIYIYDRLGAWLQPIDSLGVNGRHAVVIGPELVRIEMLRIGRTYELAITLHTLVVLPGSARPRMGSKLLFRGQQGTLSLELWKPQNKDLRGDLAGLLHARGRSAAAASAV